jgi:hypothetical protein
MATTARQRQRWLGLALVMVMAVWFWPAHVQGAPGDNRYWDGPAGNNWWNTATCWNPDVVPGEGENAFLTQGDASNRTVWYYRNNPIPLLSSLHIDATGSGLMTFNQGYGGYNKDFRADI